jgi:hypothetical protein
MSLLKRIVAKLRGLLGLGAIGGIAGFVGGTLWAGALNLLGLAYPTLWDIVGLGGGAGLSGAACGIGFGALLVTVESGRTLENLPLWRMSLLGAAAGALVPTVFMLATSGLFHFVNAPQIVISVVGYGAILGGLLSSTMVSLAKRAQQAELARTDEVAGLLEAE